MIDNNKQRNEFEIVFLRHGLSTANQNGLVQGQRDYPLAPEGQRQARLLANTWANEGRHFDLVISSPLARARNTAEIIAGALGLEVVFDEVWVERHQGAAQGHTYEEAQRLKPDDHHASPYDPHYQSGESDWDLYVRAARGIRALLERPPGSLLVVSHGAILNAALRAILGIPPSFCNTHVPRFSFSNTGYSILRYRPDRGWRFEGLNWLYHLKAQG